MPMVGILANMPNVSSAGCNSGETPMADGRGNERIDDWQTRLAVIVEMMREISRQTDPQAMVRTYGSRIRQLIPVDGAISLSRRGLAAPKYRITRSTTWQETINPWKEKDRLPVLEG